MLRYTAQCVNSLKTQSATLLANEIDLFAQQCRNTYILKRKFPVPLHKKNSLPKPLKHKHYIYEVVENTLVKKENPVDLILLQSVSGIGIKGQQVQLSSTKAYEFLLLPKLAVYATPENIKKYSLENLDIDSADIQSSQYVERTLNLLSNCYLSLVMSMHKPWTIEKWHVRVSFRKAGFIVPEDAITLPDKTISGPNLSIENKEFYIIVKINNCEEVKVRCKVHHWSADPKEDIKYDEPFWDLPSEAIFPEDQPILDSLPKHRLWKKESESTDK